MKKKRSVPSFLLAAVLFIGLFRPMPAAAATLYFTAVNDSVAPLTSDTMPLWFGGTLYVPYSVFDSNLNGIGVGLGLYTNYNRNASTVTLFNLRQMLVFDLNNGTCRDDMTGTTYTSRAIIRNGRPYLALNTVCSFFDLEYSYSQLANIPQGYLVRIKSADAVLDDALFIERARGLINNRLREYTQSLNPAESTDPVQPVNPPTPPVNPVSPSVPGEVDESDVAAYLAFCCEDTDGLTSILDTLGASGHWAVFFLTPELLEEEGNLVRRMLGTGHSVGVLASGEGTELLLDRGNRALEAAAHTRTTLAYVPAPQRAAVEELGWVCWRDTTVLQPDKSVNINTYTANEVKRLGEDTVYLTMEGGEHTARVLSTLLRQMNSSHYVVSIPIETRL